MTATPTHAASHGPTVSHGGMVRKKSRSGMFWLQRYLCVREGRLLIAKKPDIDPKRVLVVDRVRVSRSDPQRGRENIFTVEAENEERMVFAVETEEQLHQWISVLSSVTVGIRTPLTAKTEEHQASSARSKSGTAARDRAGWIGGLLDAVLAGDGVRVGVLNGGFLRKAGELVKSLVDTRPFPTPEHGVFDGIRVRWARDEDELKEIGCAVRNLQMIADLNLSEIAPALVCRVDYGGFRALCMAVDREPIRKALSSPEGPLSTETWEAIADALNVNQTTLQSETTVVTLGLGEVAIASCTSESTEFSVLARKTVPWRWYSQSSCPDFSAYASVDERLTDFVRTLKSFDVVLLGSDCLSRELKTHGIPARLLGVLFELTAEHSYLQNLVLADAVGRIVKRLLRANVRRQSPNDEKAVAGELALMFANLQRVEFLDEFISPIAMTEYSFDQPIYMSSSFLKLGLLSASIAFHCGLDQCTKLIPRVRGIVHRAVADELALAHGAAGSDGCLQTSLRSKLDVEYGVMFGKRRVSECTSAPHLGDLPRSDSVLLLDQSSESLDAVTALLYRNGVVDVNTAMAIAEEMPLQSRRLRILLGLGKEGASQDGMCDFLEKEIKSLFGSRFHPGLLRFYMEAGRQDELSQTCVKTQEAGLKKCLEQCQGLFGPSHVLSSRTQLELGELCMQQSLFEAAIGYLDQARISSLSRGDDELAEESSVNLALCYRQRGELEKALEVVRRGIARRGRQEENVQGVFLAAILNEELERTNEAMMGYEALVKMGVRDVEVVRAIVRLGIGRSLEIFPDLAIDLRRFLGLLPGVTHDEKKSRLAGAIDEAERLVGSWLAAGKILKNTIRESLQQIRQTKSIKALAALWYWANPQGPVLADSGASTRRMSFTSASLRNRLESEFDFFNTSSLAHVPPH